MTDIKDKMRDDWNKRAATKAGAFSAIIDRYQGTDEQFYASGKKHVDDLLSTLTELGVDYSRWMRVLEFGAGAGRMSIHLADVFHTLYCVDISGNMIALIPHKDNITKIATNTVDILPPFFDGVVSHLVLQHIPKNEAYRYIDEFYNILVPGGVFISQMHETDLPIEQGDHTLLVRGYTKTELSSHIDPLKWETIALLYPAGISEIWKWFVLKKK